MLLVIPSYRDASRLADFLPGLLAAIEGLEGEVAVEVVDDGSTEVDRSRTGELVEELRARFPQLCPLRALPENRGKGGAIYAAWDAENEAKWLGFVDADGAVPAMEVARLIELASRQGAVDALIGSRVKLAGRLIERSPVRHLVGRVYATLSSILTRTVIYDSQCGCKFVRRDSYTEVRSRLVDMRFGFDIDLLSQLLAAGFRVCEEPLLEWRDVPGSKVHVGRDSVNMFSSLIQLRGRLRREKIAVDRADRPTSASAQRE